MGKRSRRSRNKNNNNNNNERGPTIPPALREQDDNDDDDDDEETKENLRFQDPYVDEYEVEEEGEEWQDEEEDAEETVTLNPYHATKEPMEMDPDAYKMHFSLRGEWPSLSFSLVRDAWGESRTRFPHQLLAVVGTQANEPSQNTLQFWKLSDLGKLDKQNEQNEEEESDDDDDDDDDEEEDIDYDPVLEHASVPHNGGVNRVRVHQNVVASWSDAGRVHVYGLDVDDKVVTAPRFLYALSHHGVEGYALDFSPSQGRLAVGDNNGHASVYDEEKVVWSNESNALSIEDIQWSPTEPTVLMGGEAGGWVRICDTRAPNRAMLQSRVSTTDVNACAWSPLVTNLLATGCDDGQFMVWDLRKFSRGKTNEPLALFSSHTTPISSLEWHPTDESMIVVSDDVGSFVYDLSVEQDDNNNNKQLEEDIPPQLLFVHSGSPQTKEVHWHPQITSCLMSTALDGFHVFIPSNL